MIEGDLVMLARGIAEYDSGVGYVTQQEIASVELLGHILGNLHSDGVCAR
jgi:hypothetical protein